MPAKKPAPKAVKGKKGAAPSRPVAVVARKAPSPKPVERVKATSLSRPAVTAPAIRKAIPHRSTETSAETTDMHEAGEPRKAYPDQTSSGDSVSTSSSSRATAAAEAEDGDSGEPGSLLAGPRNVQPYIAKRGEQYMSKEQLEHFRHILGSWKQDLMEEVDRTVTHMKDEAANFPDPNDRATQEEEFSLELRTRDRERKLIRKIDEALKRIDDGSYGYCLETGEEIGIKRLEARPVATLSIEAQERRERRERQYGDRDDRYR